MIFMLAISLIAPSNACSFDNQKWFPMRDDGRCYASDQRFGLEYRGRLRSPHCDEGWAYEYEDGTTERTQNLVDLKIYITSSRE